MERYKIEVSLDNGDKETYIVNEKEDCQRLYEELTSREYIVEVSREDRESRKV